MLSFHKVIVFLLIKSILGNVKRCRHPVHLCILLWVPVICLTNSYCLKYDEVSLQKRINKSFHNRSSTK